MFVCNCLFYSTNRSNVANKVDPQHNRISIGDKTTMRDIIYIQSTLGITEPELDRIIVITEHFLIPVTAQYLPMYFTFDVNRIFFL